MNRPNLKRTVFPNRDMSESFEVDSPIEAILADQLFANLHIKGLTIYPQYKLGPYKFDFGLCLDGSNVADILIECDGKEFHSSQYHQSRDKIKNDLAKQRKIIILRFTGSEIYNRPQFCLDTVESIVQRLLAS